jgi:quinohemoprotein ethanol dehydrogenase
MAAKTWGGEWWKYGGGGTAWDGMTFDPEFNRVYIGTGNSGPYNPEKRSPGGGDNLFIASVVALDADTGKYIWHYQENPREAWDYKSTPNIITATLKLGGKLRQVILHAPTNGFLYVIDRETGKVISAGKTGLVTWADHIDIETGRPVEAPNIRFEAGEIVMRPGMIGGHNWQPMAFNPSTGLVYIPYMQIAAKFTAQKPGETSFHGVNFEFQKLLPEDGTGALVAMDPVTQTQRWKVPYPGAWNSGILTTAGNLAVEGTADGYIDVYDATTGKRLWRYNAGLGVMAQPISYAVGGKQYISVLVGFGGSAGASGPVQDMGWKYNAQPRRVLTFALGGKVALPPSAPPDRTVHAVDDPAVTLNEADVAAGAKAGAICSLCHGPALQAGSLAPDLRESHLALDFENLWAVLHDGSLAQNGMPRFDNLTRDQVRQIQSYIRAKAREALGTRKPAAPGS